MAITPKGIYYPEGTTNSNFVTIFSTLASSIDSALGDFTYDSGWIDVQDSDLMGNWEKVNTTGSRPRYRRIGKLVSMEGGVRGGTTGASTIFTLPVGFRPEGVWARSLCAQSSSGTGFHRATLINVQTSGVVSSGGVMDSSTSLYLGNINFFTDNSI